MTNPGKSSLSRVRKVPDVKASAYRKIKGMVNTGGNWEDTSVSLKIYTFGFYR